MPQAERGSIQRAPVLTRQGNAFSPQKEDKPRTHPTTPARNPASTCHRSVRAGAELGLEPGRPTRTQTRVKDARAHPTAGRVRDATNKNRTATWGGDRERNRRQGHSLWLNDALTSRHSNHELEAGAEQAGARLEGQHSLSAARPPHGLRGDERLRGDTPCVTGKPRAVPQGGTAEHTLHP